MINLNDKIDFDFVSFRDGDTSEEKRIESLERDLYRLNNENTYLDTSKETITEFIDQNYDKILIHNLKSTSYIYYIRFEDNPNKFLYQMLINNNLPFSESLTWKINNQNTTSLDIINSYKETLQLR